MKNQIEKWLSKNNTSPITGLQLDNKNLISNYTLKGAINEFIEKIKIMIRIRFLKNYKVQM